MNINNSLTETGRYFGLVENKYFFAMLDNQKLFKAAIKNKELDSIILLPRQYGVSLVSINRAKEHPDKVKFVNLYNEDLIPPTTSYDGYYFPRGIMEKWYEDAAFSLEVGEHSGIINSIGSNSAGEYVECFYIIERLPNYETDISSNFIQLSDMVTDSLIYEDMEAIKATLSFTANDFARSLDVTDLEQPKNGADTTVILIIALCVVSVGCAVTLVFTIRYAKKRRFRKTLNK